MLEPYYQNKYGVIYHGDCLDILPELPKVDLVLTDPPYGINIAKTGNLGNSVFEASNWDSCIPSDEMFKMIIYGSNNQIIFGGNYFPYLWKDGCRGYIFWNKLNHNSNIGDGEMAWTSFDRLCKYYEYMWDGNRYGEKGDIQGVGKKSIRVHPTQKPIKLLEWILTDYGVKSDRILDPFLGSGTTAIACCKLKRNFIGIEIEEKYCEIAAKRLEECKTGLTPEEQKGGQQTLFE